VAASIQEARLSYWRLFHLFYAKLLAAIVALFVWTFFVAIPIPAPPFRSALVSDLESSNAKLRAIQPHNITADSEAVAQFLPNGMAVKEAEVVLRKEWFYCGPFEDVGANEAVRWGEKYRHYMICKRTTYYHADRLFSQGSNLHIRRIVRGAPKPFAYTV